MRVNVLHGNSQMIQQLLGKLITLICIILVVVLATSYPRSLATASPKGGGSVSEAEAQDQANGYRVAGILEEREVTLEDLGYDSDETVHGMRVTQDFSINWPDAWEVRQGNALTLRFSHSPALHPQSSLTVAFNETQLTSILLTPENADEGTLRVDLPGSLIRPGYNRVHLEFYMGLDDFNCRDLDDPALWATVHNTSSFHLAYALERPELNLAAFPSPFIDNSPLVENHVTFILPPQPTPAELTAAVAIAAKLGQFAAWRPLQIDTLVETQVTLPLTIEGDLILIGRVDRLQLLQGATLPFLRWEDQRPVFVDASGEPFPSEAGILWELLSPVDETAAVLIVTGVTDESVVMAGRALASEVSYPRLAGQPGIVLSVPAPLPASATIHPMITLEELGYDERTAWGTQEQSIRYNVPLPLDWQIQPGASLDLHFAHAGITDPKRSYLTVLLNGTPVRSVRLVPDNVADGFVTLKLPARLFQPGDNALTVMSHLAFERGRTGPQDCLDPVLNQAWLVVYADSQLNLPGTPTGRTLDLANYPPAFIGRADLSDLAFVVPDAADRTIAHVLLVVARYIGRYAEGETLAPRVIDAGELESMDPQPAAQILIGRPGQNMAVKHLNDRLPQPFDLETDEPQRIESIAQIVPPTRTRGYVQAVLTDARQPRLVLMGTADDGLLWAGEALSDPKLVAKLAGDLAIIDSEDNLVAARTRSPKVVQSSESVDEAPAIQAAPRSILWARGLASGLFILTFAILGVVVWPAACRQWKARVSRDD